MKITYTKSVNTVHFNDIPLGGCFIDQDGAVCVKLSRQYGDVYDMYCFTSNELYCSDDFTILDVRLVEVELTVHAEER